jgi:hypothetical protein
MNRITLFSTATVIVWLAACSDAIRVRTDYDKGVNLHNYKTYNWLPLAEIESKNDPLLLNELTFKRIKNAIDSEMASKQIQYSESVPALLIHFHVILNNKTAIRPVFFGYNYGAYWNRAQMDSFQYREGTLLIDLMDASNKNLLWRGWGTSIIDDDSAVEVTESQIKNAVAKILKDFPPVPNP